MNDLGEMDFKPIQAGERPATKMEVENMLVHIPGWELDDNSQVQCLKRVFNFPDFKTALSFTNDVGLLAEEQNHHPALLTEWGCVTVTWWTHEVGGLHRNDFISASRTDRLYLHAG